MVDQLFRVTISGKDVTKSIEGGTISKQINRLYDVATLSSSIPLHTLADVVIEFGDRVFRGFVYSVSKISRAKYSVTCRSMSAKMTEPFVSSQEDTIEEATTARSLLSLYSARYGIPITMSGEDLDFEGDYRRKGTVLASISAIAETLGCEYWWDGSTIRIEPNKWIENYGIELPAADIFDFIPHGKTIENHGVGTVIVGTSDKPTEISTEIKCNVDVDTATGIATIRIVPHDAFRSADGITLTESATPMTYISTVGPTETIRLDTDIKEIRSITVNNVEVTAYEYKYDTIVFQSPVRGRIEIKYTGWVLTGRIETDETGYGQFDVHYGACNTHYWQGMGAGLSKCGAGDVKFVGDSKNYVQGFRFYSIPGDPSVSFNDEDGVVTSITHTSEARDILLNELVTLDDNGDGTYSYTLNYPPSDTPVAEASGESVSLTQDGQKITFNHPYNDLVVAYHTAGYLHTVRGDDLGPHPVWMTVGTCVYQLERGEACEVGDIRVDIVGNLKDVTVDDAYEKPVTVMYPDGTTSQETVDKFGYITVHNAPKGTTTLDTSAVKSGSGPLYLKGKW